MWLNFEDSLFLALVTSADKRLLSVKLDNYSVNSLSAIDSGLSLCPRLFPNAELPIASPKSTSQH